MDSSRLMSLAYPVFQMTDPNSIIGLTCVVKGSIMKDGELQTVAFRSSWNFTFALLTILSVWTWNLRPLSTMTPRSLAVSLCGISSLFKWYNGGGAFWLAVVCLQNLTKIHLETLQWSPQEAALSHMVLRSSWSFPSSGEPITLRSSANMKVCGLDTVAWGDVRNGFLSNCVRTCGRVS